MKKVIVIGAGLAGSQVAYFLQKHCEVVIYTKKKRQNCNSMLAQGGIAAAIDKNDHWEEHYEDTLRAGAYHNERQATSVLVQEGILAVKELIQAGLTFDQTAAGALQYGLEGAHSRPRILHCHGDQTGKYVTHFMQERLTDVTFKEDCMVTELLTDIAGCRGIRYLDAQGELHTDYAEAVVIAAGGLGRLYPLTTNDGTITGDGISLAKRAGALLTDMEFVQFHPTLLTIGGSCYGLISEAVRGAGGYLVDETGRKLLAAYPLKDLSPRDVVARVLAKAYEQGHTVYLAIEKIEKFAEKFPQIAANLARHQISFQKEQLIPVRPGAHFMMGGIQTDVNGQTTLPRLYAVGEAACTGVHGANRLASNSLLECIVYGKRCAKAVLKERALDSSESILRSKRAALVLPQRALLQEKAWQALSIQRTGEELTTFLNWLSQYRFDSLPERYQAEELELADLCLVAKEIGQAALKRTQSLGAHARKDEERESDTSKNCVTSIS